MALLRGLFGGQRGRSPAAQFVQSLMEEPEADDVEWLSGVATGEDRDRAIWELRYLRRALGLLVAQRDALDDITASSVAHELAQQMAADRQVAAEMLRLAERQFNERLSAYREMMGLRGAAEALEARLGRTLLLMAGAGRIAAEDIAVAARLVERYFAQIGGRLRAAFGGADLPSATGLRPGP